MFELGLRIGLFHQLVDGVTIGHYRQVTGNGLPIVGGRAAGAAETINYSTQSLRESIKELTDGGGVDVVVDPVGGELALEAYRGLAWHGRYLVIGFTSGDIPAFPANIALLKEASVVGVWWGTWLAKRPDEHLQNMREIGELLGAGKISPKVTKAFPLEDFQEAFRTVSERRALGKTVLTFD